MYLVVLAVRLFRPMPLSPVGAVALATTVPPILVRGIGVKIIVLINGWQVLRIVA